MDFNKGETINLAYEIEKLQKRIKRQREKKKYYKNAFAESVATTHALINATSDLALLIDTEGIIVEISDSVCSRVGKGSEELIGTCIYDYFDPEFIKFRKSYINVVTQSRQSVHFEDQYENMTFLVHLYPVFNLETNQVEKLAIFIADNTELKKSELRLSQYTQILATINDPMAYIDKDFLYQHVNDAYLKIYKRRRKEVIGRSVQEILGKKTFKEKIEPFMKQCLKGEKIYNQEWFNFPDKSKKYMYMSFYPLYGKQDNISGVVINSIDITKIKELEEKLKLLSQTDQLTQIYNRVKFNDSLGKEMIRVQRYPMDLTLIMFDIDHFKKINDTHGHDIGDQVLVTLSNVIKKFIRETDIFARWGGEEFMILLPHTSLENAAKLADRIRLHIENWDFEKAGIITCSFGVTEFTDKDTTKTFTKRVDRALYKAKQSGRNKVIVAQAIEKK